jgi:hypothetical protein
MLVDGLCEMPESLAELDPIEVAARFLASQEGGPERMLTAHRRRNDGTCAGCGWHRTARGPCPVVHIGNRAAALLAPLTACRIDPVGSCRSPGIRLSIGSNGAELGQANGAELGHSGDS